jgi:hypothetical protein
MFSQVVRVELVNLRMLETQVQREIRGQGAPPGQTSIVPLLLDDLERVVMQVPVE